MNANTQLIKKELQDTNNLLADVDKMPVCMFLKPVCMFLKGMLQVGLKLDSLLLTVLKIFQFLLNAVRVIFFLQITHNHVSGLNASPVLPVLERR